MCAPALLSHICSHIYEISTKAPDLLDYCLIKVRKRAKIKNRYKQAPHLTQDTNEKVITSQLDIKNEDQAVNLCKTATQNRQIKNLNGK